MKDLIAQIEQKFAILLTIGIFFPVLMSTFYSVSGGTKQDQQNGFVFFSIVGMYILAYVIFELSKLLAPIKVALHILDWTLLVGIACFALPTLFTITAYGAISAPNHLSYLIDMGTYVLSLAGITGLPFFILLLTIIILIGEGLAAMFPAWAHKKMC
jgi:hypothetical protein